MFDLNLIFAFYNIMENNFTISQEIYKNSLRYVEDEKSPLLRGSENSQYLKLLNIAAIKVLENEATLYCAAYDYENSKNLLLTAINLTCTMRDPFMEQFLNKLYSSLTRVRRLQQLEVEEIQPTPKLAKLPKRKPKLVNYKSAIATPKFTINVDESSPLRSVSPVIPPDIIQISSENLYTVKRKMRRTPKLKNKLKLMETPKVSTDSVIVLDDSDEDVSPVSSLVKHVSRQKAVSKSATKSKSSKLTVRINEIGSQISPKPNRRRRRIL